MEQSASASSSPPDPIRIVIANDHAVVHQGLTMSLSLDPAFTIVREAENGQEAAALA